MTDSLGLVERYGLPGLIILGMGWAIYLLWSRLNAVQDARIADLQAMGKTVTDLTAETTATLNATLSALRGAK